MKEDIDKTLQGIDDITEIVEDVQEARSEESAGGSKIVFTETTGLVIKHSVKAVRTVANMPEIGREIFDVDGDEAEKLADKLMEKYGNSEEAKKYVEQIAGGFGEVNQGVQGLISLKKAKQTEE